MRIAVIGVSIVVVTSLAIAAVGDHAGRPRSFAEPPHHTASGSNELIALTAPVDQHRHQVTVIDPRGRVMSVYHVELATGEITLKSVRNIHWDLQMSEFNGVSPLPREIRSLVEPRR